MVVVVIVVGRENVRNVGEKGEIDGRIHNVCVLKIIGFLNMTM